MLTTVTGLRVDGLSVALRSYEGLTLETSSFGSFSLANLPSTLSTSGVSESNTRHLCIVHTRR